MTTNLHLIEQLFAVLEDRKQANPEESYVAQLYQRGTAKIAQKVGEEAVETVIEALQADAGVSGAKDKLASESADLLFHLMVLWSHLGLKPDDVLSVLADRMGQSGLNRGGLK